MIVYSLIFIVILFLLVWIIRLYKIILILKIEKRIERNHAVRWFRSWVGRARPQDHDKLPSYEEMLDSDLPITEETFLPENYEATTISKTS